MEDAAGSVGVQPRIGIAHRFATLLIHQRDQAGRQRRNRTGAAEHERLAVDVNAAPAGRIGIAGDVGHAAAWPAPRIGLMRASEAATARPARGIHR